MIVLPLFYDQPGNAARVLYHGLGVRSRFDKVSTSGLGRLMESVVENPSFGERARRMAASFVDAQARAPSVGVVESLIANRLAAEIRTGASAADIRTL